MASTTNTTTRDMNIVRLLQFDALISPVHTGVLLRFKGDLPKEYLKDRILSIMKANPILGGTVVIEGMGKGYLQHPSEVEDADVDKVFKVSDDPTLKEIVPETPLASVRKALTNHMKSTLSHLMHVIAWETTDKEGYHVYFAVSHSLGDGATLHTYLNMLSTDMEITTLNVERQQAYDDEILENYYNHPTFPCFKTNNNIRILNGLYRLLWIHLAPWCCKDRLGCFKVSGDYIEKKKKEAQAAGGFVSTNDIITSWWLDKWPASPARFMAVNLRNRHEKITPDLAGNYLALMAFDKNEVVTPQVVRKALQTRAAHANTTPHVVSRYSWTFDYQSAVTNWASFYKTILLPGGVQEHQAPVLIFTMKLPLNNSCIIYKSSDTQYNVAIELDSTTRKSVALPSASSEEALEACVGH